ncbi:MAG: family transcriptional regulator [Hydrocarboniphaga sp.]|uniref:helix-turn-helix domain-containing protein n=1 Tax=Hydrocarboniphaga sp. TaxID=2033016 RepID=UPI00261660F0|nr:helix-turn-helix transcriptional regulator [Hydrocarboniphaga sp.]MDB5972562.1 family transcriptional regulator [Hydrocarboniphaga sp.]
MSDIAGLLKTEIIRLSKKVIRQYVDPIQKATTLHKRQLSDLNKQLQQAQREIKKLQRVGATQAASAPAEESTKVRFTAKGFVTLRNRLGLSAREMALLLDVSLQTIYNWEAQKSSPRSEQVKAIAKLRGIGKKEAKLRLEQLETASVEQ